LAGPDNREAIDSTLSRYKCERCKLTGHDEVKAEAFETRALALDAGERPPASDRTWDFNSYETWRGEIWKLIEDFADEEVRKAFVAAPPEYVVGDDLSWLDEIVERVHGYQIDSKTELLALLGERYDALRAVHGTRTEDVASFYRNGLKPLVPREFEMQARDIFLCGDYPELSPADLERAIATVGVETREGRVYFDTNEGELIGYCGHYMLYGSEYLTAIAAHIGRLRDYRQVLKGRGKATLFVCDVPFSFISGHTILEFAGMALEYVFQELLDGPTFRPDPHRGGGFAISRCLPPAYIVGHCYPTVTRDPFRLAAQPP
jgi:hypothetical protein